MAASRGKKKDVKAREERQQDIFDALKALLMSLGHEVTVSRTLEGRGGDCLVRGERRVIVARRLPLSERIEVLVDVVARQDLRGVTLSPELATILEPVLREAASLEAAAADADDADDAALRATPA